MQDSLTTKIAHLEEALADIRACIEFRQREQKSAPFADRSRAITRALAAIEAAVPDKNHAHNRQANVFANNFLNGRPSEKVMAFHGMQGILEAVRDDLQRGFVSTQQVSAGSKTARQLAGIDRLIADLAQIRTDFLAGRKDGIEQKKLWSSRVVSALSQEFGSTTALRFKRIVDWGTSRPRTAHDFDKSVEKRLSFLESLRAEALRDPQHYEDQATMSETRVQNEDEREQRKDQSGNTTYIEIHGNGIVQAPGAVAHDITQINNHVQVLQNNYPEIAKSVKQLTAAVEVSEIPDASKSMAVSLINQVVSEIDRPEAKRDKQSIVTKALAVGGVFATVSGAVQGLQMIQSAYAQFIEIVMKCFGG